MTHQDNSSTEITPLEILKLIVADDAFADLCAGIGEEPNWLKLARKALIQPPSSTEIRSGSRKGGCIG